MNVFNIKLKHMGLAYAAFIMVALYGCGSQVSQSATGGGSNCVATGDGDCGIVTPLPEGDASAGGISTYGASTYGSGAKPDHCDVTPPVNPSCSQKSYDACVCVPE